MTNTVCATFLNKYGDESGTMVAIKLSCGATVEFESKEFYTGIVMALHGNDVDLGDLGHVKPLRNSQREEIAKRLNYLDAISDTKNTH